MLPHLTAVKVDLKAFRESFYRDVVRGELKPVLKALETIRGAGTWLEIVVLLIPTLNDSEAEVRDLARWVAGRRSVPTCRFTSPASTRPTGSPNLPPTPVASVERAWQIARAEGLHFVYLGNVPGHPGESTVCPGCAATLIRRVGFRVVENRLAGGRCPVCRRAIPGVWS